MAKYATSIRNTRQQALLQGIQGGSLKLCSGTVPTTLQVPGAGSILSEHDIGVSAGSVSNGQLVLADEDVDEDSSANNSGTITYAVVVKDGSAVAQWAVPSQMSVSINGGASLNITQGNPVDIDSVVVNEGNP